MSWSIQKKGTPSEVLEAVKADPQAPYMPEGMSLLIEEVAGRSTGTVQLNTYGHVGEGSRNEAHLIVESVAAEAPAAAPEVAKEDPSS